MMASFLMNDTLNEYFNQVVQMKRKYTSDIIENVMSEVNSVIQRIHELDPRFSADPVRVGSYYQKLKINRADEFDLSIPLLHIGKLVPVTSKPMRFGFVKKIDGVTVPVDDTITTASEDLMIVSKPTELQNPGVEYKTVRIQESNVTTMYHSLIYDEFLIPYLVKIRMKQLLNQAVKDLGLKDIINMDRILHGPAITLNIKHKDIDNHWIRVNVDFAPIIPAQYSFDHVSDWPSRAMRCSWISTEKRKKILDMGVNFVAKKNFHWALSFAECEKALVYQMDADEGIRKKIHRIMKSLWREVTKDGANSKLTTYMLKNAWLWECERYHSTSDWTSVRISERFFCCMKRLEEFISSGSLPVYFNPKMDLLKGTAPAVLQNMMGTVQMMRNSLSSFQNSG